jgi:hypothetical protein
MAISEAKLEAIRRNGRKSCGPRTETGKQRSKLNAVKHGMRAATLVLLDEDAQALEDRKEDCTASLLPRAAAEQRIVDDAVEYSWLRDRARRAQEGRLATNIVNAGSTKPSARPMKSCVWVRYSFQTIAARWPITRITIGKRTGTPRACLWFPSPRLWTAIPKAPNAWCCGCKRRPAAASGCSTAGPS